MARTRHSSSSFLLLFFVSVAIQTSESFTNFQPHFRCPQNQNKCWLSQANQEVTSASAGRGNPQKGPPPKSKRRPSGPWNKNKKNQGSSPIQNRQLNSEIVKKDNASEVLQLVATTKGALTSVGGGGKLNSINISTSLHRIAKHLAFAWQNPEGNDRSKILSDPRFALLVCSASEALGGAEVKDALDQPLKFGAREYSNIAWAIAKLKIAPPKSVIPVDATAMSQELLMAKSKEVRAKVYEVAKERAANKEVQNGAWIPALSELCGHLMDTISHRATLLDPNAFQLQEFSNLLWATATAKRSDDRVVAFVISCLMSGMNQNKHEGLKPQEWANSIWALGTSGVVGPEKELFPFVADLMDNNPDFVEEFKPQELSNTIWGIATTLSKRVGKADGPECEAASRIFRHVAREFIKREGKPAKYMYKSQEITNTIWSFATLGFGLTGGKTSDTGNTGNEYTFLVSDDPEGDKSLMEDAMQVAIRGVKQNSRKFQSQELNNVAWTMARLKQKDDELLEMIGMQLANPKRQVTPQDIGTTLWSFATNDYFNDNVYRSIVRRVDKSRARFCKPQELSNVLWALATADVTPQYSDTFDSLLQQKARPSPAKAESDPVTFVIALASQELMRRPADFKEQEIKDMLWSLSRLGVRYPALFKAVAEHLVGRGDSAEITGRGLEGFSQQGMGNLAWAFARQAQLGAEVMSRRERDTTIGMVSGRLAHYAVSYIDVGESLLQKLFYAIAEADMKVHDNLSKLSPQDLSNTAWAFAIMGMKHERFLTELVKQIEARVQRFTGGDRRGGTFFNGQELANALWALATLNFVSPALLGSVESYVLSMVGDTPSVSSISKYMKRQELANIAWACAVFGVYPRQLIEILYMGLLGVGENTDPEFMQRVHKDNGIQTSAVMSILYLQTSMDLEIPNASFSLPPGFPENWGSVKGSPSKSARNTDMMLENNTFELEITSSKTQLAVGAALDRVGFDHIQEHVIDMDMLATQYGISVASTAKEVLSVDMAQVDSQIGIELDGPGHFITSIGRGAIAVHREPISNTNGKTEYQFEWNDDYQEPNGPTVMKARMLNRLGWKILNIPFWDWNALGGDAKKEEAYCRSKLEQ